MCAMQCVSCHVDPSIPVGLCPAVLHMAFYVESINYGSSIRHILVFSRPEREMMQDASRLQQGIQM